MRPPPSTGSSARRTIAASKHRYRSRKNPSRNVATRAASSAAEMTDRAAELREELRGAPKMVRGSQGQDVINPLISEWRALHLAINLTLARIKLPDADAGDGLQGIIKINRANPQRAGAHKRWRGAGA
jgi:hypothetical protein